MPERRGRTVLAFDFGLKRIGIAVGEPELRHGASAARRVSALRADRSRSSGEWQPAALVVGLPTSPQGERSTR